MEEGLCARVLKIIPVLWERWLLWWGAVNREGVIPRSNTPRHPEECSDVGISLDCHGQSPRNDVKTSSPPKEYPPNITGRFLPTRIVGERFFGGGLGVCGYGKGAVITKKKSPIGDFSAYKGVIIR